MSGAQDHKGQSPLGVYWWKAQPNFGDALSALVVAHVSGRPVEHAGPGRCDLFAVGSILQVARRNLKEPRGDGARPWVWGSGLLAPVGREFLANLRVALLRGPITAALLGLEADKFGDPGLLAAEALGPAPERSGKIGIVPHHTHMDDPQLGQIAAADPALALIDVRGDVRDVCHQIAACDHVFASSLHGLIVADSYGVPNTWLDPVGQSRLKYLDYAASVGRAMAAPVALEDVPGMLGKLSDAPLAYQSGIDAARAALHTCFPAPLRAAPHMASA